MDHITFYAGFKLMRQMGHTHGLPLTGALFEDTLISPRVTVVILCSWPTEHGDREREYRAALTREIDVRLQATANTVLDSTRQANLEDSDNSRDIHPKQHRRAT
ncbi:hypothetical protein JCGZ_06688 [Jatropha curcas]|uniref:Uncharacterized protein n=1 Tax=Jatropha curcas TaxID=180498 RepID=A0A067KNK0_JATCU|nr:hypothetical protein JCGZ_06688 [Jatropha curcas]